MPFVALLLVVVGGVNRSLVALAEFDLVAAIFGEELGTANAVTRLVYGLVGLAALYQATPRGRPRARHRRHLPLTARRREPMRTSIVALVAAAAVTVPGDPRRARADRAALRRVLLAPR